MPNDWLQSKALVWDDDTTASGEIDEVDIGTYYRRKNATRSYPTIYTRLGQTLMSARPSPPTRQPISSTTAKRRPW
jgi:hypothetical protein